MRIAVHGRPVNEDAVPFLQDMFSYLKEKEASVKVYDKFLASLEKKNIKVGSPEVYQNSSDLDNTDYILSIGGDGTLLETITFAAEKHIPIAGINTGRLGFLATTPRDKVKKLIDALYEKDYIEDERTLIELKSDEDLFEVNYALNEFTILKRDTSSMIVVHTYLNGEYLNSYWADGLIVSTPTGSTGYSLSCGGPLVLPQSNNFIVSPVSPHNLNVRPMVVSDDMELSFKIEGRSNKFLVSLDSRSKSVSAKVKLSVRKAGFKVKLVELKDFQYLQTLREKLNWGLDMRN